MLNTDISPWPCFSKEETELVASVLSSNRVNYWTGQEARKFEEEFASWVGVPHAVALANGTLALDLALYALGIGAVNGGKPSDEVIVTPRTFIASISCVVNAGANPVFVDVDANSGTITADTISSAITKNTRAVIPVHLAGWVVDLDPIMALADKHGFKVIEDCAQAHGAIYKGRSVGSIGHIGAWSFCQDKIMTTGGEGGMVTCHDKVLWSIMWSYKDHGKSFDAVYRRQHPPGFRWLHESFGTNWRMLEIQAAIGRYQLGKISEWTEKREANSAVLDAALEKFCGPNGIIRIPKLRCNGCTDCETKPHCRHARYKYYVYLNPNNFAKDWNRDRVLDEINKRGVPAYQGSCSEVYLEKAFDKTPWRPRTRLPVSRELGETSLMFLVHPTIKKIEIDKCSQVITEVLDQVRSCSSDLT